MIKPISLAAPPHYHRSGFLMPRSSPDENSHFTRRQGHRHAQGTPSEFHFAHASHCTIPPTQYCPLFYVSARRHKCQAPHQHFTLFLASRHFKCERLLEDIYATAQLGRAPSVRSPKGGRDMPRRVGLLMSSLPRALRPRDFRRDEVVSPMITP